MNVLTQLRIGARLAAAFGIVLALMLVLGVAAINRLGVVNDAAVELATNWLPATRLLGDYRGAINQMRRAESQHMMSTSDAEFTRWEKAVEDARVAAAKAWADYEKTIDTPEERVLADGIMAAQKRYYDTQPALLKLSRATAGSAEELSGKFNGESLTTVTELLATVIKDIEFQQTGASKAYESSQQTYASTRVLVIVLLLGAIALGALLAWFITRSITVPVSEAVSLAETVAAGDLTVRVQSRSRDELGQLLAALGQMTDRLAEIVTQVRHSSDSIATGSAEIATGNADLSRRTEEQASNLQQTAASMEELTATVQQNTESAVQASQLALQASDVAERGGAVVGEVVRTMEQISDSSRRIADIIGTIDGIAFQTNILALNAAVEAARAGEQGRGFAVVAGEVRLLAQRSAEAAKEIKGLIAASVERVEAGTAQVSTAGATMAEVVASVKRVSDLVGEISAASREQNAGIGQVGDAVQQLDQVTQQNAALVEESAAASDSLQQQATHLAQVVGVFKVASGRASAAPAARAKPAPAARPASAPVPRAAAPKPAAVPAPRAAAPRAATPAPKPAAPAARAPQPAPAPARAAPPAEAEGDWETF